MKVVCLSIVELLILVFWLRGLAGLETPSRETPPFSNRRRSPSAVVPHRKTGVLFIFHKHFLISFFNYSFVSDFHPHELLWSPVLIYFGVLGAVCVFAVL
ncbi:hypothetical protein P8452_61330 [Trifolium repens]|nr:hypothetical protein P8452_61330 [Trifolium repens]